MGDRLVGCASVVKRPYSAMKLSWAELKLGLSLAIGLLVPKKKILEIFLEITKLPISLEPKDLEKIGLHF